MDFLIVGPGAMGCLFAAWLKKAGFGVTILDYKPERADRIYAKGIALEGVGGEFRVKVPVITEKSEDPFDMALFCVKAYQTESAALNLASWLHSQTKILTLQNGLGNMEILRKTFGEDRVLGGVTAEGATLLGPGHVRHAGRGPTIIGPADTGDGPASKAVSAFTDAGFDIRAEDGVENLIWGKLIVNVGINALAAITRLKNGRLPEIEGTSRVMRQAVHEAVQVANDMGIKLPYEDPVGRVETVCAGTADNIASMLQDVLAKRLTEIQYINGAIVAEGEKRTSPPRSILRCPVWCRLFRIPIRTG